ncbi:MAG: malto-oligosyltrehalose trehalohydrolase, partial [Candidatus Melainabacteria bacterium]|nr:malto-oligosyltrehalose trehalohydrolase [Candidatus Melainabacteria bacterium]
MTALRADLISFYIYKPSAEPGLSMSQQTESVAHGTATKKRVHSMRFGTSFKDSGKVEFRLWAPSCKSVSVTLSYGDYESSIALAAEEDGWFVGSGKAKPGARYKFITDDGLAVPDPASRYQPEDVHGLSQIVDPNSFEWTDNDWHGLPWSQTVLYELHVGTFTPEGTFAGVASKLDYLKKLGVTAIELMPVADFPGEYGWGYDGVLPYAPESRYGTPDDLKSLIQQAHHKGIQVFLDVVYNHFGPEGNYLHAYAQEFFTDKHKTPWGAALNFEGRSEVREFFIDNALYWLEEFNIDGLRLDAVHAIKDDSVTHVLNELANRVAAGPGRERARHLVLENEDNIARFLERDQSKQPELYSAQWNDDIHHAYHVLATGESGGYYADYVQNTNGKSPLALLGRALAEGFIYQNDPSELRDGGRRGEKSAHLPPNAFVAFIQNHDQIGNRAFGDRIATIADSKVLKALTAIQLLAPSIPLLFMGEEWGAKTPFMYFCDLGPELAPLVTEGRRGEFAKFPEFSNPETRHKIPDPCNPKTFEQSKLVWSDLQKHQHQSQFEFTRSLLKLRRNRVVPVLDKITSGEAHLDGEILTVEWKSGIEPVLVVLTNLSGENQKLIENKLDLSRLTTLYSNSEVDATKISENTLPPYSVL